MADRIVILIYSKARFELLDRLLSDIYFNLGPTLDWRRFEYKVCVYAQYGENHTIALRERFSECPEILFMQGSEQHKTMGEVVTAAVNAFKAEIQESKVVVMMDDDSVYDSDPIVNRSWADALDQFIISGALAYNIRLGYSISYYITCSMVSAYTPFIPGRDKMQWLAPSVLLEAAQWPPFAALGIGEDVALNTLAWKKDHDRCYSISGFGSFLHLGCEPLSAVYEEGGLKTLVPEEKQEDTYGYLSKKFSTIAEVFPDLFETSRIKGDWRLRLSKKAMQEITNV